MAHDIFLKIDGIKGESQDATHKDEIEVLDWDWEITQESTMHSGSGGGAGKATVHDLHFTHWADCSSPNLMKFCFGGKHIPSATLVVRKAGGNPLAYMKYTMTDVIITRFRPRGNRSASGTPIEEISLSFKQIRYEHTLQNSQGGTGGTISAAIDIPANKEL
jgi:type VI secretion system secreted protein Hcp